MKFTQKKTWIFLLQISGHIRTSNGINIGKIQRDFTQKHGGTMGHGSHGGHGTWG
jgi:hypothetical protein